MFFIDFSSTIATTILLCYFCRINFLKVFMELQKEFSMEFSVLLGSFLVLVRKLIDDNQFNIN